MKHFLKLVFIYLRIELRLLETLSLIVSLAIMLSTIVALGVSQSFVAPNIILKLFPTLIWLVFILSATVAIGRSFEYDLENNALAGLLLEGVSPPSLYLARLSSNLLVLVVGHLATVLSLVMFLNVSPQHGWCGFALISGLAIFAYAALSTLLAGIAIRSKVRQILLPIILLPLLFPLFFAANELSAITFLTGDLAYSSFWLSLLVVLDAAYVLLGINLFEYVIRE